MVNPSELASVLSDDVAVLSVHNVYFGRGGHLVGLGSPWFGRDFCLYLFRRCVLASSEADPLQGWWGCVLDLDSRLRWSDRLYNAAGVVVGLAVAAAMLAVFFVGHAFLFSWSLPPAGREGRRLAV